MDNRAIIRRILTWVGGVLIAAPVFYFLSIGPVVWWSEKFLPGGFSFQTYDNYYRPLRWACEASPAFRGAVLWYAELWGAHRVE